MVGVGHESDEDKDAAPPRRGGVGLNTVRKHQGLRGERFGKVPTLEKNHMNAHTLRDVKERKRMKRLTG